MKNSQNGLLRWIAVFKLGKAALMLIVGIGVLRMIHHNVEGTLDHWVSKLDLDPGRGYFDIAIGKLVSIPPAKLKAIGVGSFVYAGLFLAEGIGLWLHKRWAEWFTAIITTSLLPIEIYEMVHHPTFGKALVLVINLAVVVYLVLRLRKERLQPSPT